MVMVRLDALSNGIVMILQFVSYCAVDHVTHWVVRRAEGLFHAVCCCGDVDLVRMELDLLFLGVCIKLKVARHVSVIDHVGQCKGRSGAGRKSSLELLLDVCEDRLVSIRSRQVWFRQLKDLDRRASVSYK